MSFCVNANRKDEPSMRQQPTNKEAGGAAAMSRFLGQEALDHCRGQPSLRQRTTQEFEEGFRGKVTSGLWLQKGRPGERTQTGSQGKNEDG